jgi:hypothetical protein
VVTKCNGRPYCDWLEQFQIADSVSWALTISSV